MGLQKFWKNILKAPHNLEFLAVSVFPDSSITLDIRVSVPTMLVLMVDKFWVTSDFWNGYPVGIEQFLFGTWPFLCRVAKMMTLAGGGGGIQRPLLKSFISVHLDYFQVANMVYFICTQWCGGQIWSKVLLWVPTLKIILCPSKYVWGVPKKFWAQSDRANKAAPGFCVLMNLPSKKG